MEDEECPACQEEVVMRYHCRYNHYVCNECLPKCKYCPLCRADLRTFVDEEGIRATCTYIKDGCLELGPHQCSKQLFGFLPESSYFVLTYIVRRLEEDINYEFSWGSSDYIILEALIDSHTQFPKLWDRLFPNDEFREQVIVSILNGC